MSDWSSFQSDKGRHDKWRAFLTESKTPQKIQEVESYFDVGASVADARDQARSDERRVLKTDKKLWDEMLNYVEEDMENNKLMTRNRYIEDLLGEIRSQLDTDERLREDFADSDLTFEEFSNWVRWRTKFPQNKKDELDALRAKRDASPIGSKRSEEEEVEAEEEEAESEEESTPFFDRMRDMGAKAKDTMTKKRNFFSKKSTADAEEYPASGFASLYKTLDDINKRLKVADRDTLYDELEKLFKDQNFVVQESQIMIEAPGEIEGGALILGRNPQFDLESYPALSKLVQSAATNAQLAQALKSAFVGAGFEGVNVSPAAEPEAPAAPAEPEAAREKPEDYFDFTDFDAEQAAKAAKEKAAAEPDSAEPSDRTMPSGAEPPVRPMPSGAKSKAQKFEPSAETAVDQSGNTKIPATSVTTASKVGIGSGGQRDRKKRGKLAAQYAGEKTYEEAQLREHWQKLAGIIKG